MRQIRKGVFETNSSSSHSIAVKKDKGPYSYEEIVNSVFPRGIPDDWDGVIRIDGYEDMYFGWGWDVLKTFWAKARFALASYFGIYGWYGERSEEDSRESSYPPEVKEATALLKELIPGFERLEFVSEDAYFRYGEVDHQSRGLLPAFISKKGITLREFLLNREYVVFIDNDNSCVKDDKLEAGDIRAEDYEDLGVDAYALGAEYYD